MSVTVKKPVYYENNNSPATGLSPTATCKDITNNQVLFTGSACTADSDIDGLYTIDVVGHHNYEYVITFDAGTDSVDNRKQAYTFIVSDGRNAAGGVVQIPKTTTPFTKEDFDFMVEELKKGIVIPESPDMMPMIEEAVRKEIKSLDIPKPKDIDLSPIINSLSGLSEEIRMAGAMRVEGAREAVDGINDAVSNMINLNSVNKEAVKSLMEVISKLNLAADTLSDSVVEDIVEFFAALEAERKQSASNTLERFRSFKSNK